MNEKLEEFEAYLKNRRVAIIGLGVSNVPLLEYMHEKGAIVTTFDNRNIEDIPKDVFDKLKEYEVKYVFGKEALKELEGFDIIFRSPSCMPTIP